MTAAGTTSAAGSAAGQQPFGSVLSVSDFAALNQQSIVPLGAVMGCDVRSIYVDLPQPTLTPQRKAWSGATVGQRYENDVVDIEELDRVVQESRLAALVHLRDEAAALGANLVVGVRQAGVLATQGMWSEIAAEYRKVRRSSLRFQRTLDFQLVGTAVRAPGMAPREPRLTTLTASEIGKLREIGWQPVGIVASCSHKFGANVRPGLRATEIVGATALWADAREKAFGQLRGELSVLGATGMIGLDVSDGHSVYERSSGSNATRYWASALLVSVSMVATAIEPTQDTQVLQSPTRILTLR